MESCRNLGAAGPACRRHACAIWLLSWCALVAAAPPPPAQSLDERFLDGLRERRLYELAESYCRSRLAGSELADRERAELVVELSRSLTEHALASAPQEREPLWRQALEVLEDFARRRPESPRRVLVDVQGGLVRLARGELARQEAELVPAGAEGWDEARGQLRWAIRQLNRGAEAVADQLRQAPPRQRDDPDALKGDELLQLSDHVRYQLARAYRNQGQSYPPNSPDRANSLMQAVEALGPLARKEPQDPLAWQSRLDEIACYRLLQNYEEAARRLARLDELQPPPRIALGARAERIRLALAAGRLDDALAVIDEHSGADGQQSADLDYATLETYLAAWQVRHRRIAGNKTELAAEWQDRAAQIVRDIDRRYGAYWSRRAELLLAGTVGSSAATQDVAVLLRAAESFYRSGQIDQSLATYDRVRRQARLADRPDAAFDAAYTAAAIEQARNRNRAAAARFREAALANPAHPKAPDAHLLAIFNTARAAGQGTSASADDYLALLEEHLARWPQAATASQARWWLGRLRERERAWPEAVAAYQRVAPDHPQFLPAVEAVRRCYEGWLAGLEADGEPTRDVAAAGAHWFEGLITGSDGRLPEGWNPAQRLAAVSAAHLWLRYADEQFDRAERIVSAALSGSAEAPEEWKGSAQLLLALALAGQGRRDDARGMLDRAAQGSPEQRLALVEGLAELAESANPSVRRELAELQLRAVGRLVDERPALSTAQRRRLDLAHALALAAAGRGDEALAIFSELARALPRDGPIQEAYGQALLDSADAAAWRQAVSQWREVQQKSRPGGDRWFRAMYYRARAHERLGEKDKAAQLVKLARGMHPDLGGPAMKARFLELLARCRQ